MTIPLTQLSDTDYKVFFVDGLYRERIQIAPFMQKMTGKPYKIGSAYFLHTKDELFQPTKKVAVRSKSTGNVYVGDAARDLLGLGDTTKTISPARHPKFDVFLQSKSVNRLLVPGTEVLYIP